MKVIYFDCFAGAAGDMILGALVDAGLSIDDLRHELQKLNIEGWQISDEKVVRNGITGRKLTVETTETNKHRHLNDIKEIIEKSDLADNIKTDSFAIFEIIAHAEAKIHNTTPEQIHFHEVGALDAIIDIVGTVIGLDLLGVENVYCSHIHLGTGFIECAHGTIPLPSPATIEILKGIPVYSKGIQSELTTPTGAAILKHLSKQFGPMPALKIESAGYGAGTRDLTIPNHIRAVIGEMDSTGYEKDRIELLETCIDDMNPEIVAYVMEQLREAGALDVYLTPIQMKKNRPAFCISVLSNQDTVEQLLSIIFSETTTIGVRRQSVERYILNRQSVTVTTELGPVQAKLSSLPDGTQKISPEYEDCKRLAEENSMPLQDIYSMVLNNSGDFRSKK